MKKRFFLSLLAGTLLLWGCGGGATGGTVDLSALVTLPPSSSQTSLTIKGAGKSQTTEETPQPDMTCIFYDAATDAELGRCRTGSDGRCTADVSGDALSEGNHDIFIVVKNEDGEEVAGGMNDAAVTDGTEEILMTVNSEQDLAYDAWRAACEEKVGAPCVPGENIKDGIAHVVPACIRDAFVELADGDDADVSSETSGNFINALLEAHKQNLALGAPIDMACVLKGNADCQQSLGDTIGSEISSLGVKKAVATSAAASTAATVLDAVVGALCGDAAGYATIKSDADYQADRGATFKLFEVIKPAELSEVDETALNAMIKAAPGVGAGLEYFADPLGARAMMETFIAGGITNALDSSELEKRMGVIIGAPPPPNFAEAAAYGRAAFNIYGAVNWQSASAADAVQRFGPLLGTDFRGDCIQGGRQAFDNYIDAHGGLAGFQTAFDGAGGASAYYTAYEQVGVGESCTTTFDCLPPFVCSASSKCSLGSLEASFTGGPGTSCTANSSCATDKGFACDAYVHHCIYTAGQASGGAFAVGGGTFTYATAGTEGAFCSTSSQCSGGRSCLNGGCFTPPPSGYLGGAPLGASCSSDSGCASQKCSAGLCIVSGGNPNGAACTEYSQCASGSCYAGICANSGFSLLPNGYPCSVNGQCSSGHCRGGLCDEAEDDDLKGNGQACYLNSECQSAICSAGICSETSGLKANGQACYFPAECASYHCINAICQEENHLKPNGYACVTSTECESAICTGGICGGSGYLKPYGVSCVSSSECQSSYCYNGLCY